MESNRARKLHCINLLQVIIVILLLPLGSVRAHGAMAGGMTMPGMSMSPSISVTDLTMSLPNEAPGTYFLVCYQLKIGPDGQTKYLEPIGAGLNAVNIPGCWDRNNISDPLVNGKKLIIGIYAPAGWGPAPSPLIQISVTFPAASPLNPTPLRPSIPVAAPAAAAPAAAAVMGMYYYEVGVMTGDTVPTISINYIGPPLPGPMMPENQYSLLNDTLPQVHSISRFNLSAGVVYNTVRTKSFGFNGATPPAPIVIGQTPVIDPVLFFTFYPFGLDAERDWQPTDLIPGISIGLSLSSPASNFYLGGMSEFPFIRNVQIVYGLSVIKVPELAPSGTFSPAPSASSSAPTTVQKFTTGAYFGLSFNITGFISSLFKAAGG